MIPRPRSTWECIIWLIMFWLLILMGLVVYDWHCRGKKRAYDTQRDCIEKCQEKCSEHGRNR